MSDLNHVVEKFLQMLQMEKEEEKNLYIKQLTKSTISERIKSGITWFPLRLCNIEYGLGEYLIFEFERPKEQNDTSYFQIGKTIEIFGEKTTTKENLKGVIKSMSKNRVVISTTCDELPDWMDDEKVGINMIYDEFSFREMEFAIKRLVKSEKPASERLSSVIYGERDAAFDELESIEIETLNSKQNEAVNLCLAAKDIAIIHGPPGTGKTTTVVEYICKALKTEKSMLVCSPSNLAVDLLAEKLLRKGINVVRVGNPIRISDEILNNTLDGKLMSHSSYKEIKELRKRAEEYRTMARKYKRSFGPSERQQRELLFKESKALIQEARELEDYIIEDSLNNAQVVCSTLVGSSNNFLHSKRFGTVVIDEAAQALEPACWIAMHKADKVILAGDHKQLSPTVKCAEAEKMGLGISLMEKLMLRKGISVMLEEQYRMNDVLVKFPSMSMYNHKLVSHVSVANRLLLNSSTEDYVYPPLEFIDTAGCGYEEDVHPETKSVNNKEEAALLLDHLAGLMLALQKNKTNVFDYSVGVISPYSRQVQVLNELIIEHPVLCDFKNIKVKTIDGFQGREKDIIYISLVRSNNNGEIGFLQEIRRLNVAITRAKQKLVVFGDSATICSHPYYNQFVEFCQENNYAKSAWDFIYRSNV